MREQSTSVPFLEDVSLLSLNPYVLKIAVAGSVLLRTLFDGYLEQQLWSMELWIHVSFFRLVLLGFIVYGKAFFLNCKDIFPSSLFFILDHDT